MQTSHSSELRARRPAANSNFTRRRTRNWVIITIAIGLVMVVMDGAIANVALPAIAQDLNASPAFSGYLHRPSQTVQLYLARLWWIEAEVSSCSETAIGLRLRPTFTQHEQLVVSLFGTSCSTVADTASMNGVIVGTISRAFRGEVKPW
jgi:MFS family permease